MAKRTKWVVRGNSLYKNHFAFLICSSALVNELPLLMTVVLATTILVLYLKVNMHILLLIQKDYPEWFSLKSPQLKKLIRPIRMK